MEKNVPFGPNVSLPTIEGMASTCEAELYTLMREIDLAFERNHKDLISEVERLKVSERAQQREMEGLKTLLKATKQPSKVADERIKQLLQETETLKNENNSLKNSVQNNSRILVERDNQIENLKSNLEIQKEENGFLKEKLTNLNQEHSNLKDTYQSLLHLVSGENTANRQQNEKRMQSDIVAAFISQEKEKYLEEENEHCNELLSKISSEIEQFRVAIGKEKDKKN
ncbi:hypothetical protein JTE90_019678 [Oedothorax gibbosus]|uniref:Uncharacterized protein n=1 Tax=Oedothorax gibbosus TaxID=931172 RepID=A0AAV6UZA6_9ARAC|nr:hypothetical protein JTE90_019678 [Oedothorax gibbosus]